MKGYLSRVVKAHRLREVKVQIGFTRLEPSGSDSQGEPEDINVRRAPLSVNAGWLPAATLQGEGIFIELDHHRIEQWLDRPAVKERLKELQQGAHDWFDKRPGPDGKRNVPEFLGGKFYLLHSLSHLLISAISIECGYSASAISERIYFGPHGEHKENMAGILLHTGTVGSEGTLGGLVSQTDRIAHHLRRARRAGSLCSSDPLCGSHSPAGDDERAFEGAACHGCLFISESSCERFNRYLDRALVVPTLGQRSELAFFDDEVLI